MHLFRTLLSLSLLAATASACSPEEDLEPMLAAEDTPIDTVNGAFTLRLEAAEGQAFPKFTGPTTLAIHIENGPDPLPPDPEVHTPGFVPPLKLSLGQARPYEGPGGPQTLSDTPKPVTPDGFKWMTVFDFKAKGWWVQPVTITDLKNRSDTAEIVFVIEDAG